ncbi:4Fe-4S ferredoxin-type domain-containing protein [Caenorhabditis elegans]|uniref:4Fe-4S ferredoxin-type domain-containing protein n=1 Tax=Caenorhabditis elegans TaxID=6239 RepID=Q09409_CAEEL|nr:RNA uridylyltransferase [Caenorhabditis elegans]CCD72858.1 RNA uridylyltransferase [Caenorhabditis elegans]|eukprot:NP_498099.1 Caffeine Induced Death (S. pombe Cid) homolog [Caenorhabditis elegans]
MTDEQRSGSRRRGGALGGGRGGNSQNSGRKRSSNSPADSASSSQKTSRNPSQNRPPMNIVPQKVTILKRNQDSQPTSPINRNAPPGPLVAAVQPLMAVELGDSGASLKGWNSNPTTPEKTTINVAGRQAEANKKQTQEYYFSKNAGSAVSAQTFQETVQYPMSSFPLEKNVPIQIDNNFTLLITPTTSKCNGLFIKVKLQHGDDNITTGALLKLDADEKTIRKSCRETIENLLKAKSSSDRFPFSKCSEGFLTSCLIKKLVDRLEAFPEAIYYCEKCDYHINTIGHAKAHLESSTHFDDVKRQEQREHLLKIIPPPTEAHLESVEKVLEGTLKSYQQVRQNGIEIGETIIYYLSTTVFPSIGLQDVILRPFGSVTYDVTLPDSDYNVAYTMSIPEGTPIFALLEQVRKKIADDGHPADHSMEMGTPSTIIFTFKGVRVKLCWMSCFNHRIQLHFSELMKTYVNLREEVAQFLQLIRLWATKAGLDSKNKPRIGLPRYGFDIMAIHFLQQIGCLPVLHELFEAGPETEKIEEMSAEKTAKLQSEEAGQRRMRLMSRYEKNTEKIGTKFDLKKSWNLAELFIGFFRYYVERHRDVVIQITQLIPMSRDVSRWNKKILHVVDPFRGDNVLSIPKVSTWQPFFFNCLLTSFVSFSIPRTKNGPLIEVSFVHNKTIKPGKKFKDTPKKATVEAPIPLTQIMEEHYQEPVYEIVNDKDHLKYMKELKERLMIDGILVNERKPIDYHTDDHRECVYGRNSLLRFKRVLKPGLNGKMAASMDGLSFVTKKGKKFINRWKKANVIILSEDSSEIDEKTKAADSNVSEIAEKLEETLKISSQKNIDVAVTSMPVSTEIKPEPITKLSNEAPVKIKNVAQPQCDLIEAPQESLMNESMMESSFDETESPMKTPIVQKPVKQNATFGKSTISTVIPDKQFCSEEFFIKLNSNLKDIVSKSKSLKPSDFHYEFSTDLFCGDFEMEMKCTHCDGSHCVENCPMMEIPPIKKYQARTPEDLKDIDDMIDKYYHENILDERRLKMLDHKIDELQSFLRKNYREDVTLTTFGSVMTGLSVNCSDIDICLRFGDGDVPPKDLTAKEVIQKTESVLRKCHLVKRVQAIVTAKVPIVKFQVKLSNGAIIDVDISYYNILAIYNTALLKEYSLWTPDKRFAKLALFVKTWAKNCEIGDASRGSLSSYCHVIMLISYLQNCDPPVLPRLQEDFRSDNRERRLVDNWDTSFAQVETSLLQRWPKNKESCAQLLIGYFDYYSRFDFRNFVVQCRREMILSKMEKEWPRPLCVEDPFDLSHNLSSGVNKKMFVFIMKVFINSRAVFMSEKPPMNRDHTFLSSYQHQLLRKCNQGSAPTDRQCHQCHRIGHFVESCPQRALAKEARKRFGSNSTNSSYRSNDSGRGFKNGEEGGDRLTYHKRTYYHRSYNK